MFRKLLSSYIDRERRSVLLFIFISPPHQKTQWFWTNVYNLSFSDTTNTGTYTVRIIANDTSSHQNINSTETTYFIISGTSAPNVTSLIPQNNSVFNVSDVLRYLQMFQIQEMLTLYMPIYMCQMVQ